MNAARDFRQTSIVIAIDDAGNARRALDYGLDLAETLRLPVRLVHVARTAAFRSAEVERIDLDEVGAEGTPRVPEFELAVDLLERALARAEGRRIEAETVLLGGEPAEGLLQFLEECDRPMLVMGRRGQSRIQELLLGSVSDQVIRHARCPVIVIS
ncbi:MAG: universal stress protein [Wenzhouxiangella sp.]|jgi:nucleotide-binding universal stress UspA family protein|nr:universal stress protein [Wenzhouxiangella sp.]